MSQLTIRTNNGNNITTIENLFIDNFMPKANGEFVKIYLYLIRIMNDPTCTLTISSIADYLEHTEKDIERGLSYWKDKGLLNITRNENQHIIAIDMITPGEALSGPKPSYNNVNNNTFHNPYHNTGFELPPTPYVAQELPPIVARETTVLPNMNELTKAKVSPVTKISKYSTSEEFKQLLYISEAYFDRALSKSEIDGLQHLYDDLKLPTDLIEFAVEYSVDGDHRSINYIKAVAIAWSKEGITTVDAAKKQINNNGSHTQNNPNDNKYLLILRSFGITNRMPTDSEKAFMNKWTNEYGFNFEVIHAACDKTILSISKPSFPYADTILQKWLTQKIISVEDIKRVDLEYQNAKEKFKSRSQSNTVNNHTYNKPTTNNFEQREYENTFDSLEEQLLKKAMTS